MKRRFVRADDQLDDDAEVVVRGGALDRHLLRIDARRMFEVYGVYGISVFSPRNLTVDELAQRSPLVRFEHLTLVRAGAVHAAGLDLQPTGRNLHHYTILLPDLDGGVERLIACNHVVVSNPYHET